MFSFWYNNGTKPGGKRQYKPNLGQRSAPSALIILKVGSAIYLLQICFALSYTGGTVIWSKVVNGGKLRGYSAGVLQVGQGMQQKGHCIQLPCCIRDFGLRMENPILSFPHDVSEDYLGENGYLGFLYSFPPLLLISAPQPLIFSLPLFSFPQMASLFIIF